MTQWKQFYNPLESSGLFSFVIPSPFYIRIAKLWLALLKWLIELMLDHLGLFLYYNIIFLKFYYNRYFKYIMQIIFAKIYKNQFIIMSEFFKF